MQKYTVLKEKIKVQLVIFSHTELYLYAYSEILGFYTPPIQCNDTTKEFHLRSTISNYFR